LVKFDAQLLAKRISWSSHARCQIFGAIAQTPRAEVSSEQALGDQKFADEVAQRKFVTAVRRKHS
jgi:hypothetical protein